MAGVKWRLAAASAALALLAASVAAAPAQSAPVGPLGAAIDLGTTKALPTVPAPQLAALPDGTTMAAWVDASGAISVRVRAAGSSSWGAPAAYPLEVGWSVSAPSFVVFEAFWLVPAGPSAFLMVWQEESGGLKRIRAQRLTRTGAAAETAQILAGPAPVFLADVATNASGRAAVSILRNADPIPFDIRVRSTPTSAWGGAITVGSLPTASLSSPAVLLSEVAVHDSGTVCTIYPHSVATTPTGSTVALRSRCGAPSSLASASEQVVGNVYVDIFTEAFGPSVSMQATKSGFMVAGLIPSSGVVALPTLTTVQATAVRIRVRSASTGSWSTATTLGLPGELNLRPTALASASGVAVHYVRLRGALGSLPASPYFSIDQQVAQRVGTGAWSSAATVASIAASSSIESVVRFITATLGPAGEMLVSAPTPALPSGWITGFMRRSSWTGVFTTTTGIQAGLEVGTVISASGRATALGRDFAVNVRVAQSALPKPFVRQAAQITTAPRVGTAASCTFAFTDAATVTRQWRVNGTVKSTASTYTPKSADRGKTLTCRVTGTNPTGSTVSTSAGRVVT